MFKCIKKKKSIISSCVFYLGARKGWGIGCQRAAGQLLPKGAKQGDTQAEVSKTNLRKGLGSTRSPDHQERLWWCCRSKLKLGSQSTGEVQCSPGQSTATRQISPSWGQVLMDMALTRNRSPVQSLKGATAPHVRLAMASEADGAHRGPNCSRFSL